MKKRIHLIAAKPDDLPQKFWSQTVPEFAEAELINVDLNLETLRPQWKEILKFSDGIIVDRANSSNILQLINGVPRRITEIQCLDSVFKDKKGNWWSECFYREILHESIVAAADNLDTSASAYITGEGAFMRIGMSVLVQLGYRKINLVLERIENSDALSDVFKRLYFDTEFNFLPNMDLTLQKNDGTILINTASLVDHQELKEDLTYLNFIFGAGLVVDTQSDQVSNPVMDEALHVGLRVLFGHALQARADWKILSRMLGPLKISLQEFEQKWFEYVQQSVSVEKLAEGPVTKGSD